MLWTCVVAWVLSSRKASSALANACDETGQIRGKRTLYQRYKTYLDGRWIGFGVVVACGYRNCFTFFSFLFIRRWIEVWATVLSFPSNRLLDKVFFGVFILSGGAL